MGSWQETCTISNLPIYCGEDAVLTLFHNTKYLDKNLLRSNSLYSPYPLIIKGKYDDYGGLYDVSGDIDLFCNIIEKEFDVDNDDIEAYYYRYYSRDKNISDNEFKLISHLKYLDYNEKSSLSIGFIHKQLFDELEQSNDYLRPIDEIAKEYLDAFTFKCRLQKMKQQNISKDEIFSFLIKEPVHTETGIFYKFNVSDENYISIKSIKSLLGINSALLQLRKLWLPSHMSSQNDINKTNKILNNFYTDFIKNKESEYDEE